VTLSDPKSGGWALNELLTSSQMNAIRTELLKAIDGVGGGTYALTAPLIFTGDDVRFDSDDIDIVSGGELSILSGGLLSVESGGAAQIESGGDLNVLSGGDATVLSGGTATVDSGGLLAMDGTQQVSSGAILQMLVGSTLQLNDLGVVTINSDAVVQQWDGAAIFRTIHWESISTAAGGYVQGDVALAGLVYLPCHLLDGDQLTQVRVRLDGGFGAGHGGTRPDTLPTVELIRRNPETGGGTSIAGPMTDPSASAAAYDVPHDVTLGSLTETGNGNPYAVIITGETGPNSVASTLHICGVEFSITREALWGGDDSFN